LASPWSRDRKIKGNKENQHVTEGDFAKEWIVDIDRFKKVTSLGNLPPLWLKHKKMPEPMKDSGI